MKGLHVLMVDLKSYYPSPAYQLGLLVTYASLEEEVRNNVTFTFLESSREEPARAVAEAIVAAQADLVAMSNYAWNYGKICEILDLLTASGAEVPRIVLGGPNSEGAFGDAMLQRYPVLSALVVGEGEPAFRDICSSLVDSPRKNPFVQARNCVIRTADGAIERPNPGHRIQYLDEVPSPYLTGIIPAAPSPLFYETNRGCPYRCSFCYWGNGNAKIYRLSMERIREEMEFFARNRVASFWMADANFGIFKTDADIAEMMCEINARHRYPFKHVGVNWAKNSSDRVLEIAEIFRRGRMGCTTTLALQSVTPEAEEQSRRYSMPPSQFVNLVRSAHEKDIDTYTDIIWGLPGEDIDEYLDGLDAIISTGVPAMWIRQLHLLPGTEFYDNRETYGLTMLSEASGAPGRTGERSEYWEYMVISHPKMSRADMKRGTRIIGINHLVHNHNLGKVVDFFLARYGITHRQVYTFFDDVLLGRVDGFPDEEGGFLETIREQILTFADGPGRDEVAFYRHLSESVWFKRTPTGRRDFNDAAVRRFMHDFYRMLCRSYAVCQSAWEQELLADVIDYNVLIAPKPAWRPDGSYSFRYDVHAIWKDLLAQVHVLDVHAGAGENGAAPVNGRGNKRRREDWGSRSESVRTRLANLLSDAYLASMRGPVTYVVDNPWHIPPSRSNSDWLLSNRSKHCSVSVVDEPAT